MLRQTGKVGIAKVVIQTKQHLAMLAPLGPALVLDLLRWGDEIRTLDELNLPAEGVQAVGINAKEMAMAEQLVSDMSGHWNAEDFANSFKQQIMELVDEKVHAGQTETVRQPEAPELPEGAQIYDLTEMLRRSLRGGTNEPTARAGPPSDPPAGKGKSQVADAPAPGTARKQRPQRETASAESKPAPPPHGDAESAGRKPRRKAAATAEKTAEKPAASTAGRPPAPATTPRKKAA